MDAAVTPEVEPIEHGERASARDRRQTLPVVYASLIGDCSLLTMPFVLGSIVLAFGLSVSVTGRIVSLQFFMMIVSSLMTPALLDRVRPRTLMTVLLAAVAAGNMVCAIAPTAILAVAGRIVIGFAEGGLMAMGGALAAGLPRPARAYAIIGLVSAMAASAALAMAPPLMNVFGPRSIFVLMGSLALIGLFTVPMINLDAKLARRAPTLSESYQALRLPNGLTVLIAFMLYTGGGTGLFVYAQPIGQASGYSLVQIGSYLAIGQVFGIPGPMILSLISKRFSFLTIFAIGFAPVTAAVFTFVFPTHGWMYSASAAAQSLCAMYLIPHFRTLMAGLDKTGRLAALSVATYATGACLTPVLMSFFIDQNVGAIAFISAGMYVMSFLLIIRPSLAFARAQPAR